MKAAIHAYRDASARDNRDRLILAHVDYVKHVLARMSTDWPAGVDVENLEAAGLLGLVEAVDQFDATRGVPFKAFASQRIRGAVIDEMRRNSPLPQHMLQKVGSIRRAYRELGSRATIEQVAARVELTISEVEDCLTAERITRPTSWDEDIQQAFQSTIENRTDDPETAAEQLETKRLLADGIDLLPERERLTLTLYYLEDLRLKEIALVLGLSESRVCRVLAQAELRLSEYVHQRLA